MTDIPDSKAATPGVETQPAVEAMPHKKSVLLDTCVLARLSLYFEACLAAKLEPGCTIDELHRSMCELRLCSRPGDLLAGGSIKDGRETWAAMVATPDSQYSYSLLSQLETQVLLEERAVDALLLGKVPFRLWRNKPLRMQTEIDYDAEVLDKWTGLISTMETVVNVQCIEGVDEVRPSDIVDVSNILSRHLVLDPIDLYLYSCAVFAMVDEVWTYDGDLRILVEDITTNGHFQSQRGAMDVELADLNEKFGSGGFTWPSAISP